MCDREKMRQAEKFMDHHFCLPGVPRAQGTHLGGELCLLLPTKLAGVTFSVGRLCIALCHGKEFSTVLVNLDGHLLVGFCSSVAKRSIATGARGSWGSLDSLAGWLCCDVLTV